MFCGYLLIYNVFEIAVTNDIRQYGLLRTVGTTSQQIKRLVNRQALYLFLIGTPFGLLFGILLGRSILPAALQMFAADYSGKNIEVSTLPYLGIIAGAILFSGLTVYISTRKSVKKASRVSPIEAIRYVEQNTVSIKRKKTNTGAVIPRMAKANLQRNKRRTVFIVISLTLSIVLLNSVFIFSGSFDEDVYVKTHTKSDFAVYNPDIQAAWGDEFGHSCTVSEKSVEEIEQQPGVINEVRLYRNTFEDDHIACDWGPSFSIDNTDKYAYVLPDSLNLGWTEYEDGKDYAALTADNAVRVAPNPIVSSESGLMMWLVAGIFGILFMFCGYLLIYNVFEIAVTNDIRQYGLLRTVGTTSRQIRRLVNRQALYLFLIGTPFGLLFGTLLGRSILPIALQIFAVDFSGGNIEVGTLPYLGIIAGAILFSGLTVYISTRKSVKKASRVSPIEAIRYVEQDTVSIKRKKTISGAVIPRMAKANLQRNKRRTVFIVISLTLSIVLLNSVFIFSGSFDEDAYIENQTRSDFIVYSPGIQAAFGNDFGHDSAVPEKAVEEIKEQPGVTNEVYLYRNTFEDDHISCDWGTPYVVDNTYKEQRMLPEHLNLGVYQTENYRHTVGLTADNHPLGNVFGFSENFFNRLDIIEGETDLRPSQHICE